LWTRFGSDKKREKNHVLWKLCQCIRKNTTQMSRWNGMCLTVQINKRHFSKCVWKRERERERITTSESRTRALYIKKNRR
jgi:hypothetical protein